MNTACPYCAAILNKEPKRTTKCPQCGKSIYPRPKQPFYSKPLLTEDESLISDTFESLTSTVGFDITIDTYKTTQAELSTKFKSQASWSDVTWSIYNQLTLKFAKVGDLDHLSAVYSGMASFLWHSHKDFRKCMAESVRHRLLLFKQYGFKTARVYAYSFGDCKACEALTDKTFGVNEALKDIPLPPKDCTCVLDKNLEAGYCGCSLAGNAN